MHLHRYIITMYRFNHTHTQAMKVFGMLASPNQYIHMRIVDSCTTVELSFSLNKKVVALHTKDDRASPQKRLPRSVDIIRGSYLGSSTYLVLLLYFSVLYIVGGGWRRA